MGRMLALICVISSQEPDSQLFMLDDVGKIHTKLDDEAMSSRRSRQSYQILVELVSSFVPVTNLRQRTIPLSTIATRP